MTGFTALSVERLVSDPASSAGVVMQSIARNVSAEWPLYSVLAAALVVVAVVDIVQRRKALSKYGSRNARTDMLYGLFELSHIQALIVIAPVAASLNGYVDALAPWLRLDQATQAPAWAVLIVSLLAADFCGYWIHRFKHENRWLWQFHKVHHSQEHLTILTHFRFPLLDRFLDFLLLFPLGVITGSAELPLVLLLLRVCRSMLEHSGLDWTYGPLGLLVVSPSFHGVHHSRAPEHINRNYGNLLTVWDRMFGTVAERGTEPLKYGLAHERVPECFWRQNLAPVVGIVRLIRNKPFPGPKEAAQPRLEHCFSLVANKGGAD